MSERADPSKYEWWCYECEKFVPSSEVCLAVHTGPNGCQGDCTPLPEAPSNKKDLRIRELEQRLAAVEGLPVRVRERMDKWALRINVENGRMVPPNPNQDGEWITVRMAHKMITDELQAALHPKAQNAEDCAE